MDPSSRDLMNSGYPDTQNPWVRGHPIAWDRSVCLATACAPMLIHVPLYRPVQGTIPSPVCTRDLHIPKCSDPDHPWIQGLGMDLGSRSRGIGSWGPLCITGVLGYAGMASEAAVGPLWGLFSGDIRPHPSHGGMCGSEARGTPSGW